jgi:hypothetical protein
MPTGHVNDTTSRLAEVDLYFTLVLAWIRLT